MEMGPTHEFEVVRAGARSENEIKRLVKQDETRSE